MNNRLTRQHVFLSEVVKLLTLRSVRVAILTTVALCVGMAALTAPSIGDAMALNDPGLAPGTTPETVGLEWVGLGLIGVSIVGVIAGSSEYTGHQLKTSLISVPSRTRITVTKSLALLAVTVTMAVVAIPALSLLSQLGLGELGVLQEGVPASLIWRWLGGLLVWGATAQIGFALGVLLRQAILPLFLMIVISQLTLPLVHLVPFAQYLPFAAGTLLYDPGMITGSTPNAYLPPLIAGALVLGWTGLLVGVALIRFQKRDVQA